MNELNACRCETRQEILEEEEGKADSSVAH